MATQFFMPVQNILGENALAQAMDAIAALGLKKALIVTDPEQTNQSMVDKPDVIQRVMGANDRLAEFRAPQ